MKFPLMIMALIDLFALTTAKPTSAEVLSVLKGRNKSGLICCDQTAQPWVIVQSLLMIIYKNTATLFSPSTHSQKIQTNPPLQQTYVATYSILAEITALKARGGKCIANGRSCVQIACTDFAEVVLCNDNDFRIEPNCEYLASYAFDILGACNFHDVNQDNYRTCGQEFDSDRYNIIVKQSAPDVGCPN